MTKIVKPENTPIYHRTVSIFDSQNIKRISYNVDSEQMFVEFSASGNYLYSNVPPHVFGAIVIADSVGSVFNDLITKNPERYPYKKVGK